MKTERVDRDIHITIHNRSQLEHKYFTVRAGTRVRVYDYGTGRIKIVLDEGPNRDWFFELSLNETLSYLKPL